MIRIRLATLRAVADHRPPGYEQDVVSSGTVEGEFVLLDEAVYASLREKYQDKKLKPGAGHELKALLAGFPFYITTTPTCSCNARAKTMDQKGIQWCEENVETICGWLEEEAKKRKLPFLKAAGRALVRRAIRNAKKKV